MLNIMIVDDEPLVREQLLTLLECEKEKFHVAAEAYDGEMALNYLKEISIDIIITDIKMPIMDGLELIRQAKTMNSDFRFIILSAYDEFELVRESFKLGVFDYLLKSNLRSSLLLTALNDIKVDLQKDKKNLQNEEDILHQNQLRDMLVMPNKTSSINSNTVFSLDTKKALVKVALIKINIVSAINDDTDQYIEICIHNFLSKMLHPLKGEIEFCVVEPAEYALVILLTKNSEQDINNKLLPLLHSITKYLKDEFRVTLTIGVSDTGNSKEFHKLYKQAKYSCMCQFFGGAEKIYYYASVKKESSFDINYFQSKVGSLKNLLLYCETKDIQEDIKDLMIKNSEVSVNDIEKIKELFYKFAIFIDDFSLKNNINQDIKPYMEKFSSIHNVYGTLEDYNQWIYDVMIYINDIRRRFSKPVRETIQYLKKNYNEDISLATIADYIGINSDYLCRIFKNEVGCTINKYIEQIKISNAIDLMKNKGMKIYEISQEVGYHNEHYFSRVFKKVTGVSPKKFLQRQF